MGSSRSREHKAEGRSGKRLYITATAAVVGTDAEEADAGGVPDVCFVHRELVCRKIYPACNRSSIAARFRIGESCLCTRRRWKLSPESHPLGQPFLRNAKQILPEAPAACRKLFVAFLTPAGTALAGIGNWMRGD